MSAALVSVLMAARDAEPWIGEAIDSALAQTHEAVEVVVVDDGSRDATADVAAGRPGVRVLRGPGRGPAAARNAALAVARGELIAVLDADDVWPADRLARQVAHLEAHPGDGVVVGLAVAFSDPARPRPAHFPPNGDAPFRGHPNSMLARRATFDRVGAWDAGNRVEDLEWLVRARDAGVGIGFVDAVTMRYRIHATNGSRDQAAQNSALIGVLRDSLRRRRETA